jgi:hypothetical protein
MPIRDRLAAKRLDLGDNGLRGPQFAALARLVAAKVIHHHLGAFLCGVERDAAADASTGSRDENNLAVKQSHRDDSRLRMP